MGYVKIWIHLVWTTRNRQPLLKKEIRRTIFGHIKENAGSKGIWIDHINGHLEHVHCLISLGNIQSIDKVMMLIKGESSHWINKQNMAPGKFEWQDEYYAVSVGESSVERVRDYIQNQENHHRNKTFKEEFKEFLNDNGLDSLMMG